MKTLLAGALALAFVVLESGCGPGIDPYDAKRKLFLTKPLDQDIKAGEASMLVVSIRRERFDGDVVVRFEDLPPGVTILEQRVIPSQDDITAVTVQAAPDAPLVRNHIARVLVEGPEGLATWQPFYIDIWPPKPVKQAAAGTP